MNDRRRKQITEIIDQLDELKLQIEQILEDESEAYENLPEGIQGSERGCVMESAIDNLDSAVEAMTDVTDYLSEAIQ